MFSRKVIREINSFTRNLRNVYVSTEKENYVQEYKYIVYVEVRAIGTADKI